MPQPVSAHDPDAPTPDGDLDWNSLSDAAKAILDPLNPEQRQAVLANDGPLLILAGAGSGKTRTITHKIAWLIGECGVRPWEILAVTFTNKAAGEMKERCQHLLGSAADALWLGTFHRIGVRILRTHGRLVGVEPNFNIYDRDDQKAMMTRVIANLGLSKDRYDPKTLVAFIERAKHRALDPDELADADGIKPDDAWIRIYRAYEDAMREANACDFNDLLVLPLRIVQTEPLVASELKTRWRYILVDEFQDTNRVQYEFLKAVLNDDKHICVVGDDDQSIYRWRGADVDNILSFDRAFRDVTVVRLERNYRSSANILAVSGAVISRNTERHDKELWTDRDAGAPVKLHVGASDLAEADWVSKRIEALRAEHPLREMAIFYRTHAQSRVFEDSLRHKRIPYSVIGGQRFYERMEVKDAIAYLRVLHNPADVVSFERIINTPPRGIGKTTVLAIRDHAAEHQATFWDACRSLAADGTGGQKKKLKPFVELIDELRRIADEDTALEVAVAALDKTGYVTRLKASRTPESEARLENLSELLNAIEETCEAIGSHTLEAYLEQISLVTDIDRGDLGSDDDDKIVMMSAHTAKGLEFDVVFVTGLEYGLMPHFNSIEEPGGIEEERRLAYVAMTRARHHLHLTRALSRRRFGALEQAIASPFLDGLPRDAIQYDDGNLRRRPFARPVPGRRPGTQGQSWAADSAATVEQSMPSYEDFSQDPSDQQVGAGSVLFHPRFGEGLVTDVRGEGPKAVISLRFSDGVVRRIQARFLTPP